MDEKTVRIAVQIPKDMVGFLERLARREGFEARKIGRAIRWCIREAMKRESRLHYLRQWREFRCLSPAGLAELADIPERDLAAYEAGDCGIGLEAGVRLAQTLGITLPQLLAPPGQRERLAHENAPIDH